eukprot:SAG31_NODE_1079_length_10031_cov_5.270741_8_plen_78_part_00
MSTTARVAWRTRNPDRLLNRLHRELSQWLVVLPRLSIDPLISRESIWGLCTDDVANPARGAERPSSARLINYYRSTY